MRIIAAVALLCGVACSNADTPPAESKTKAQRDSAVAKSGLPGAAGVAGAMSVADSARARQAALDSASRP